MSKKKSQDVLTSLAEGWNTPEEFIAACDEWAKFSPELRTEPEFSQGARRIFGLARSAQAAQHHSASLSPISMREIGRLKADPFGNVIEVDNGARQLLAIQNEQKPYDAKIHSTDPADARVPVAPDCFAEVVSRKGVRYSAHLVEQHAGGICEFALIVPDIAENVEGFLRGRLALTTTEIEIMRLLVGRMSVSEIADFRGGSINTIRTHIHNINRKMGRRSVTESVAAIYEIYGALWRHNCPSAKTWRRMDDYAGKSLSLLDGAAELEYFRFGPEEGRPLVILPSMEYGAFPPRDFLDIAEHKGYCVYVLIRPGFSGTTPVASTEEAAALIGAALEKLGLKEADLVALSSAVPTALELLPRIDLIKRLIIVNFLLESTNKTHFAKPSWIAGLLDIGAKSADGFNFAVHGLQRMIDVIGLKRFYRSLYPENSVDLDYIDRNWHVIEAEADLLVSADESSLRLDLVSAFQDQSNLEALLGHEDRVAVIFGASAHGVPRDLPEGIAARAGIRNFIVEHAGRYCLYHRPRVLFEILQELDGVCAETRRVSA